MAKKEINIILRAKNAMSAELSKAGEALKNFGESAVRIGKVFATAFLAAGTAVAGFAVKALQAWSVQEAAEKSAEAALRAHGDEIENNMNMIRKHASAIQNETGVADENIIARMSRLRMIGVEADQLGEAARATVALASAGMGEEAAIKAVAMARQGNFSALERYIPALRNANDATEKAAIVNDFLTKGYSQQKDQLNTVSGQWNLLKNRVGDVWEELGRAISQNNFLIDTLKKASNAVAEFGARIQNWMASGGVVNLIATFRHAFEIIHHGFNQSSNIAHIAFAAIGDGAETAIKFVIEGFKTIGRVAVAVFEAIRKPSREAFRNITKQAATMVENVEVVSRRTEAALEQRARNEQDHAKRVQDINEWHTGKLIEMQQERVEEHAEAMDQITIAEENLAKKIEDLEKQKQDAKKKTDDLEKKLAEEQKRRDADELGKKIEAAKKEHAVMQDLAKKRVGDLIADAKREQDLQKEIQKDQAKADRLRTHRGLSKKDQEWLDAFEKIQAAQKGVDDKADEINMMQQELDRMRDDGKKLEAIKDEIVRSREVQEDLAKDLAKLLVMQ
jgi:chromosome segregation ATPase